MLDRSLPRWIAAISLLTCAFAAPRVALSDSKPPQPVQLPYVFNDDHGSTWDVQADGSIGDGGNDLFDGGGRLTINDVGFTSNQAAALDSDHNEIVFPAAQINGLWVSRRVGCNVKLSYLRYTEILANPTAAPIKATLHLYFNMGSAVRYAEPLVDEKKAKQPIGMVVGDDSNTIALIGAGRGSKVLPRYVPQPGSDDMSVFWDIEIPAKQTLAITHLVCRRSSLSDAGKVLDEISDKQVVSELPKEIAGELANFPRKERFVDDQPLLRGQLFDQLELRSGDQLSGTLKNASYRLNTLFGAVDLPADHVLAAYTAGRFRPRQLMVTTDGEILGGQLEGNSVPLELATGQVTNVPLAQIARFGYRHRDGEPDDFKLDRALVTLRDGQRWFIEPITQPLRVATRYGMLELKPQSIASIGFAGEDQSVHEIELTDGSRFAGLVQGDALPIKLTTSGRGVSLAMSQIRRLQLSVRADDPATDAPALSFLNGDQFFGSVIGVVKMQTKFDTLAINGDEIGSIQHVRPSPTDAVVTVWDRSAINGQLVGASFEVAIVGGGTIRATLGELDSYINPQPKPPAPMVERIKGLVTDLNAEEWPAREVAQEKLISIGQGVARVLRDLRPAQPTEAQQRIDVVLTKLSAAPAKEVKEVPPAGIDRGIQHAF